MKIAVVVDKRNGMLFNNRRLSKDNILREKLFEIAGDKKLFVNEYSASQFEGKDNLMISDSFLEIASDDDICFVENCDIDIDRVDEIYLFNWNRDYPADRYFSYNPKEIGFKREKKEEFAGSSHKKITLEVYRRVK